MSVYFEEKLQELYPDQTFPVEAEEEVKAAEEEDLTEDSEDEFVEPRRKRLKTHEKALHIK